MKFSVLDSTPKRERVIRLEVTGTDQELELLMEDLCNCSDLGIDLRNALERVLR